MGKTNAERGREYRERLRARKLTKKKAPKSSTERTREWRARIRAGLSLAAAVTTNPQPESSNSQSLDESILKSSANITDTAKPTVPRVSKPTVSRAIQSTIPKVLETTKVLNPTELTRLATSESVLPDLKNFNLLAAVATANSQSSESLLNGSTLKSLEQASVAANITETAKPTVPTAIPTQSAIPKVLQSILRGPQGHFVQPTASLGAVATANPQFQSSNSQSLARSILKSSVAANITDTAKPTVHIVSKPTIARVLQPAVPIVLETITPLVLETTTLLNPAKITRLESILPERILPDLKNPNWSNKPIKQTYLKELKFPQGNLSNTTSASTTIDTVNSEATFISLFKVEPEDNVTDLFDDSAMDPSGPPDTRKMPGRRPKKRRAFNFNKKKNMAPLGGEQAEEVNMEQPGHLRPTAFRSDSHLEAYGLPLDEEDQPTTSTRPVRAAKAKSMEKMSNIIMMLNESQSKEKLEEMRRINRQRRAAESSEERYQRLEEQRRRDARRRRALEQTRLSLWEFHPALQSLSWLIGCWNSITASASYPTMETVPYREEMQFFGTMQPVLQYKSETWHTETQKLMHCESGFLRVDQGLKMVAFMVAHNFGVVELSEGALCDQPILMLKSKSISRMSFTKNASVTEIVRSFELKGNILSSEVSMATVTEPLQKHLVVKYAKVL